SSLRQRSETKGIAGYVLEHTSLRLELIKLRRRLAAEGPRGGPRDEHHDSVAIRVWQSLEQHCVDDRKDGDVCPDAERKRRDRGNRKNWCAGQRAKGIPDVGDEIDQHGISRSPRYEERGSAAVCMPQAA